MQDILPLLQPADSDSEGLIAALQMNFGNTQFLSETRWLMQSADGRELRLIFDSQGHLMRLESAISQQQLDALVAEVASRLERRGRQWARHVMFSDVKVRYSWTSDNFSVHPMPTGAAEWPGGVWGSHPFVVEYQFDAVADPFISSARAASVAQDLELLLGCLLLGVRAAPSQTDFLWGIPLNNSESLEEYIPFQVGYSSPHLSKIAEYPLESTEADLAREPDQAYYTGGIGDEFTVPQSFDSLVAKFFKRSTSDRERFLRSAYWLAEASERFGEAPSAALVASVQAVEALLPDRAVEKCPTCGQDQYRLTRRFREFLLAHGGPDKKAIELLYRTRSKLTHGSVLLYNDLHYASRHVSSIGQAQSQLLRTALMTARVSAVNWLLADEAPPAAHTHAAPS